jgi:hypothetical protein
VTDDELQRGLGALEDTPDIRDYPIDALYAAEDREPPALDALTEVDAEREPAGAGKSGAQLGTRLMGTLAIDSARLDNVLRRLEEELARYGTAHVRGGGGAVFHAFETRCRCEGGLERSQPRRQRVERVCILEPGSVSIVKEVLRHGLGHAQPECVDRFMHLHRRRRRRRP